MPFSLRPFAIFLLLPVLTFLDQWYVQAAQNEEADLIIHNAKVLTADDQFTLAEAIAIRGDRIIAVGTNQDILKRKGPKTQMLDVGGKNVLPGLYDSHTHPSGAATSELTETLPFLQTLDDVFAYVKKKTTELPEGKWIVLRFAFPTRLKDARFPTKEELDKVAPNHPVYYNAGPASLVNSMGLKVSGITKDTPNPSNGVIVKDPKTGEPTGMLRNASGVLKGVGSSGGGKATKTRREAIKELFGLYNEYGITSIADRNGSRGDFDLFNDMHDKGELTLRVNMSRGFSPYGTREEIAKRFQELPGKDGLAGPTGKGGVWVRIGPIKFFLDGGMLNGTAYMRTPWPKGPTYQIIDDDYKGLLFVQPDQVKTLVEEAVKAGWQVTAHTAGEGAMDVLLDAYEFVDRMSPIKKSRHCITHANFPSQNNLERCQRLGVCADIQPVWLYKDGHTLFNVLGEQRMRWFHPYKSWVKYTTIGGGSDHMIKLDPHKSTNPWDPWIGIATAITCATEQGLVIHPDERLSRQEALRLYTHNNAYLHNEEAEKGTLSPGKLADLIVIDRDYLTCPENEIAKIRVLKTMVGGKMVYERK